MNSNLSSWERFLADTPPFFKKAHAFGIFLIGLAFTLSQTTSFIPSKWLLVIGFVGLAVALLSTFAVKDIAAVESGTPLTLESAAELISDLSSQFAEVKGLITNPPADLGKIVAIANDEANIPTAAPVININNVAPGAAPAVNAPAAQPGNQPT